MSALKSTQVRYTVFVLVYFIALVVATFLVIKLFVAPDLQRSESIIVGRNVDEIGIVIGNKLHQVEAQSRAITQSVPLMDSASIDLLQPGLVDQYGDPDVFGGGIWPLPFKRDPAKERFSTFFARDASGKLQVNTHWNTPESLKYFEQTWWKAGATSPRGQCTWAKAYKDDASPQPRTNCAMAIYKNDALYGVSTIDVTLGFFNRLVADMEKKIGAQIVLVEADGKIVSNTTYIKDDIVLKNVSDLATTSPMVAELRKQLAASKGLSAVESTYDDGVAHTLFLKPIAGSPWLIATGLPTSMLTQNSDHVLGKLAMFQAPMVVILLLLIILGLRMLMKQLANLKGNIDALSSGDADLTRRLPLDSGSEFNAVAHSFNTFIERLQALLQQIQHSTTSLASAARQIAGGNLDLSSRTEEQASSLEETAASMEELTANVQQNSVHAQQANTLARDAAKVASRGGEVVGEVVQTMGSISASSKKIVDIISVIDGIAFQTNILALNASVEAARAGEQGRGFSVVASEVRNLAQSSAVAARDIKQLIVESVTSIDAGSEMAAEAGRTMTEINRSVANVAAIMNEIQAASQEQSQGIEQVNRAVTQLDDMTQQNAALVEEAAAAAKAMEEQTNLLEGLVGGFRLH